jgi:hypothetical protein
VNAGEAMKYTLLLSLVVMMALGACWTKDIDKMMGKETRSDVFQNTAWGERIPSGFAELTIVTSLKTHEPGIYPYGSKIKGTPDYVLLLNIDGQNERVKGHLSEEKSEPKGLVDAEAGKGIRYFFKRDILLAAGNHRVLLSLPEDKVVISRELTLKDGTTNTLRLKPIYRSSNPEGKRGRGFSGRSGFMAGIVGFWVYLNGSTI